MSEGSTYLIGGGQIHRIIGQRGKTPPCPAAKFKRGDVVKIRAFKDFPEWPRLAVVAVAIPPGFSPDHALADLLGEERPLMARVGARTVTYILVRENDPKPYLIREKYLRPSGEPAVEIGAVKRGQP
jgi:hypothetical protein